MEPRGALASTASARSSGRVHFGGDPEGFGGRFAAGEGSELNNSGFMPPQQALRGPLSEQLFAELERISPQPSPQRRGAVEHALAEVLSACQACIPELATMREPGSGDALLPIGSYHLGVATPEDEVDVVFVAPLSTNLQDFLQHLSRALSGRPGAKNFTPAGTDGSFNAPGMRLEIHGIAMTVLVAQRIPALPQPRENAMVHAMAGLFAREASEKIIGGVPSVELFRGLLRFVRMWAKRRGVYGSHLGFPSGTAWAICCSRVCQMYPGSDLAQLAVRFFRTLSRWDWRQPLALDVAGTMQAPEVPPGAGGQNATMSILLPVGSGICITRDITDTTMKIIQKELRRGYKMVQQVELARAHWSDVYKEAKFFSRHRHYLEFDFLAADEAIFASWLAWGKQQIKGLVGLFETMSGSIVTLRPWPEWVDFKDADWPHAKAVFVGLHLERGGDGQNDGQRKSFDLREPIVKFLEAISAWPEADRYANRFELLIKHVRLSELEKWLEHRQEGMVANQGGAAGQQLGGHGQAGSSGGVGSNWSITEDSSTQGVTMGLQQCSL